MHKQEASYLFSILSNGERVKILKMIMVFRTVGIKW